MSDAVDAENVIVFDGECVLCCGFFRFVLNRDRTQCFAFATAQSPVGQQMYQDLGLSTTDFETNLVRLDGEIYQRLDAVLMVLTRFGGVWPWFRALRGLPRVVKDPLYFIIARNRYRLFGRRAQCMIPAPDLRARFVPGGFTI